MIQGHGDDAWRFGRPIRANFSSNVFGHVDLARLKGHLATRLDAIGRYPEPEPYSLERALAGRLGIAPDSVCVTNGATEAIYLTAHAFAGSRSAILGPTFSEYADACAIYNHIVICAGQARDGLVERQGSFGALRPHRPQKGSCAPQGCLSDAGHDLIWLCNPNNPTGSVVPKAKLAAEIEGHPDTVYVIDQSYGFFTREPLFSTAEAAAYPNVILLHSMTKRYAMPGLRLGYVTGDPNLVDRLRSVRMPWSVNALAIEAGLYLCEHPDTAPIDLPSLLAETQRLRAALDALPGLTAEPTQTHFFLCRLAKGSAADLKLWLADMHGLLIRDASNFEGLDAGCFRIATQTPEENDMLIEAISRYLEEVTA
ncbi:MAG: pyridoxal phosphate-dependent class II aminotransferase [Bacteroidales bacterium]|nr:pyridoxal phosphate-dependent class II aminotransferase [Bacteroidales bacterium]